MAKAVALVRMMSCHAPNELSANVSSNMEDELISPYRRNVLGLGSDKCQKIGTKEA